MATYRFIQQQSPDYPVRTLCEIRQVSRSGYYQWLKPPQAPAAATTPQPPKVVQTQLIKDLFTLHPRRYGTRRLVDELKDRGQKVSRNFVRKVLADNGLKPIPPRSFVPRTTDSNHKLGYSPNRLPDQPALTGPNQVWVSDITYISCATGKWLYLCVWIELWSRRVVGWYMADHMRYELIIKVLRQALHEPGWCVLRQCPCRVVLVSSEGGSGRSCRSWRVRLAGGCPHGAW
jgi:putative transposase